MSQPSVFSASTCGANSGSGFLTGNQVGQLRNAAQTLAWTASDKAFGGLGQHDGTETGCPGGPNPKTWLRLFDGLYGDANNRRFRPQSSAARSLALGCLAGLG